MIRFLMKVAIQRLIGTVPGGPALYERARQRRIIRHIDRVTAEKRAVAEHYLQILRTAGGVEPAALSGHLEFGGGWLPVIPLVFHRHGLKRQVITDIAPLMRMGNAAVAAAALARLDPAHEPQQAQENQSLDSWLARCGVSYLAPQRPPAPFADASFDLVTITQALQYPPPDQIRAIHQEAARLLRPGGWYMFSIKLDDQYRHFDPALPRFNFLRYSAAVWRRWFDNPYTPFNRLRAVQHRELLEEGPFDIVSWATTGGGPEDVAELRRAPPHPEFARFSETELACDSVIALARRR